MRPAAFTTSLLLHTAVLCAVWGWGLKLASPVGNQPGDGEAAPEFSFFANEAAAPAEAAEEVLAVVEFKPPVEQPPVAVESVIEPLTTAPAEAIAATPAAVVSAVPVASAKSARRATSRSGLLGHGTGSGSGGGAGFQPPSYRACPAPPYPAAARKLKLEGAALLLVQVDDSGRPTKVSLRRSTGSSLLDDAAVRAVWGWRFEPARAGGQAIAASVEVPIRFRFRG
jgi:protein TonB